MLTAQSYQPRLKTSLWVEAHVRQCFLADMPAFIVAKGDAERGNIILKINRFAGGITLYEQALDFDGNKMWRALGAFASDAERDADLILQKKRQYDPDIWIIEIEDGRENYTLDAPISEF
jgi:hypothetical protein